jgi:hypothetical protein
LYTAFVLQVPPLWTVGLVRGYKAEKHTQVYRYAAVTLFAIILVCTYEYLLRKIAYIFSLYFEEKILPYILVRERIRNKSNEITVTSWCVRTHNT